LTHLFQGSRQNWNKIGPKLGKRLANNDILTALGHRDGRKVVVVSNGYDFIVRPLLEGMGIDKQKPRLVACRLRSGARDRESGKLMLLTDALGHGWNNRAILVTHALDDLPILDQVAEACLTKWPKACYESAISNIYFPFRYISKVKHPGQNYFLKTVVAEDWAFAVLATSLLSSQPVLHATAVALLIASFWCVYEVGYMENDLVAEQLESDGKLSQAYEHNKGMIYFTVPWVWAILFSLPGLFILGVIDGQFSWAPVVFAILIWMSILIGVRVFFHIYNYSNKPTRIWLYPALQAFKSIGVLAVTTTNVLGATLLMAQIMARWNLYLIYRFSGKWISIGQVLRVMLFIIFLVTIILGDLVSVAQLLTFQTSAVLIYSLVKARREITVVWRGLGWTASP